MLSGDEVRQILETVDKLQLPAELRAEEDEEEEDKEEEEEYLDYLQWKRFVSIDSEEEEEAADLMKGLMMVARALMYQVGWTT